MKRYAVLLGAALTTSSALAADIATIDWSKVPAATVTLFYPGQASYEWIHSAEHKKGGAKGIKDGKNCLECHEDEEADIGNKLAAGKRLEPTPIAGKDGTKKLTIQAAYDKERIYLKASWPTSLKEAGAFHDYKALKDGKWVTYGSNRTNTDVKAGKAKVSYEDRFNVLLGDGKGVPEFNNLGCWVTCHNSMRDMPNAPAQAQVEAHPALGKDGLKRTDIRKYLPATRSATDEAGGWDKVKPKTELDALMGKGAFLDLWQARAYRSLPVGKADDSHVFQYRNFDSGRNPFDSNWDGAKKQPKFMFDPAKNGGRVALTEAQFRDPKAPKLADNNSVPFDPAKVKDGDVLPGFILNTRTEGSADDLDAKGAWADGMWTMYVWRKLDTGNKDDVALVAGQTYPIGLAVHDDNVTTRFHHVSFPLTLGVGTDKGDIKAVELK